MFGCLLILKEEAVCWTLVIIFGTTEAVLFTRRLPRLGNIVVGRHIVTDIYYRQVNSVFEIPRPDHLGDVLVGFVGCPEHLAHRIPPSASRWLLATIDFWVKGRRISLKEGFQSFLRVKQAL